MNRRVSLVLVWLAACGVALITGFGLLNVMAQGAEVSWATQLPRSVITVPMICVIVFWGVVRATGVPLQPLPTFTFGALAVYLALFVVGRILTSVAVDPTLVIVCVIALLMALAWVAVRSANRRMPRRREE